MSSTDFSLSDTASEVQAPMSPNTWIRTLLLSKVVRPSLARLVGPCTFEGWLFWAHRLKSPKHWRRFSQAAERADLLVMAGGNMVMDEKTPMWPALFHYYCETAHKKGCEVRVAYIGVGPVSSATGKRLFGQALRKAKSLSVRDHVSYVNMLDLGVKETAMVMTADPVFLLPLKRIAKECRGTKKIGLAVLGSVAFGSQQGHRTYLQGLVSLVLALQTQVPSESLEFVLFSTELADTESVELLKKELEQQKYIGVQIGAVRSLDQLVELYSQLHFLIGGRMHSLIFAHRLALPFSGILWAEKLMGFAMHTNTEDKFFTPSELNDSPKTIAKTIARRLAHTENEAQEMRRQNIILEKLVRAGLDF